MAETTVTTSTLPPVPRLIGMIVGIAASIAIAIGVLFWGTEPNYTSLYSGLEARDAGEVVAALQSSAIPYKLDGATGSVMVETGRVHEARLKLAEQGLPKGTGIGIEILQAEQDFGTSQFVENARYHHAMETELARTISTMRNVKSARVHLAIPKRSVFVRERTEPSASVALSLYGGRSIEQGQVDSIVHLVASSIPHLSAQQVTVVDQNGRLLSSGSGSNVAMTANQYEYNRKVEMDFVQRIEHLLEPIVGIGKVRATVNAEIDFTEAESTEELFNPDRLSVRSEQASEITKFAAIDEGGVPGAQSNQPPDGGTLVQGPGVVGGEAEAQRTPLNSNKNSVRNYELDRTIRHTRQKAGAIKRLTVAVLVDDKISTNEDGEVERTPLTNQEIQRITTLVQQTIGFVQQRGDLVNVINASFTPQEAIEALPELGMLEQPWVRNLGKQILAGIIILVLIFTIVRPTVKNLTSYQPIQARLPGAEGAEGEAGEGEGEEGGVARLTKQESPLSLPSEHDQKVDFAKSMVQQDALKVANVVRDWIGNEA